MHEALAKCVRTQRACSRRNEIYITFVRGNHGQVIWVAQQYLQNVTHFQSFHALGGDNVGICPPYEFCNKLSFVTVDQVCGFLSNAHFWVDVSCASIYASIEFDFTLERSLG